jgi:glutamine amidotransferase
MADIALIDYQAGNLTSVRKGFAAVDAPLFTPAAPAELAGCTGIVVPGVGHFGATVNLDEKWRSAIATAVSGGVPLLGICLGLQWFFEGSDEAPALSGLSVLNGRCFRLHPPPGPAEAAHDLLKVPHVGWNALDIMRQSRLLEGVSNGTQVYFTHSYAAPITPDSIAATTHGTTFAAAVERENVFGVQFHPEKSGNAGLRILANFVSMTRHALETHHRLP